VIAKRILACIAVGLLTACGPSANTAASCNAAFAKRADFVKQAANADKIDWLPELIRACGAKQQWMSAAKAYPEALLGAPDPFHELEIGCASRDPDLTAEPLCREIAAAAGGSGS
jgi:hypothetical protein